MNWMKIEEQEQQEWKQFEESKREAYASLPEMTKELFAEWNGLWDIEEQRLRKMQQDRRDALKVDCSRDEIIAIRKKGTQL